jgi:hypothetical protein
MASQAVVKSSDLSDRFGRQPLEKAAQGRGIGKILQAQHGAKDAIVLKDFSLVDSPKTHNNCIKQSQNEIRWMIFPVPLVDLNVGLKQSLQADLLAKTVHQPHATEEREVPLLE